MSQAMSRLLIALGLAFTGVQAAQAAEGGLATAGRFQLSVEAQYGVLVDSDGGNPYQLGVGLEAGYTLDMGLYVGIAGDYFLGEEQAGSPGLHAKVSSYDLQAEVGYDIALAAGLVLRPKLGIGLHHVSADLCTDTCASFSSESHIAIAPAVQGIYLAGPVMVGAEVRAELDLDAPKGSGLIFGLLVGVPL